MQTAMAMCGGNLSGMHMRCQPACCGVTTALHSSPSQPLLSVIRPVWRPFGAAGQPARMRPARQARLACRASEDGWWRSGEQHWTFVESEQQLQQVVEDAPNVVLVDCYTPWCGGCKMISPNLTRMAAEKDLQKLCTFVKVDTDKMRDWASSEAIKTLPYLAFYRRGEGRLVGMQMTPQKLKLLRKAIATLAENRGKKFRLDPNGFIVPVEPVAA